MIFDGISLLRCFLKFFSLSAKSSDYFIYFVVPFVFRLLFDYSIYSDARYRSHEIVSALSDEGSFNFLSIILSLVEQKKIWQYLQNEQTERTTE